MSRCNYRQQGRLLLLATAFLFLSANSRSQSQSTATPSTAQIVHAIERHDQAQAKALEHYHTLRHYEIEYRGLFKHITAKMDVEFDYDAAKGKTFSILSESGSRTLCEKVIKRALDAEMDASHDRGAHALTPTNYKFEIVGSETLEGRSNYVLHVEPLTSSPYLYRGKIWVDAADGAVSKTDVEPARDPSFWIAQTMIQQTNSKINGFWLTQRVRSESKVRIVGGKATMTIDYSGYKILRAESLQSSDENNRQTSGDALRASMRGVFQ